MAEMNLRSFPCSSLDGHKKTRKDIRKNIWCAASDLKTRSPRQKVFYLLRYKVQLFVPYYHPPNSHLMEGVIVLQF
jgi:hypothetical protein